MTTKDERNDGSLALIVLAIGIFLGILIGMAMYRPYTTTDFKIIEFNGCIYKLVGSSKNYEIINGRLLKVIDPEKEYENETE